MAFAPRSRFFRGRKRSKPSHAGVAAPPYSTLDEVIELVIPHLPAGLIGPGSAARICSTVHTVPAELVARFGLDCRLSSDTSGAEVHFSADSETGGMQMLAGRHPLVNLTDAFATADSLSPVARFCARREPGRLLHRATRDVWVDLVQNAHPSFSFGMRLDSLPEADRRPVEVLVRALELGLAALRGAPLPPSAQAAMGALVRRLPDTARVERAGLVAARPDGVRLWLARMTPAQMTELVDATRGRDEARRLRALLDDIAGSVADVRLRVDVGAGVGRASAIVCTVDATGSPGEVAARWRPLLDRLVARGLCTAERRDALLTCFGLVRESQYEQWPEHLLRLSAMFGESTESILSWRVGHVTIECDRGEPLFATAQIVAAHGWSRR